MARGSEQGRPWPSPGRWSPTSRCCVASCAGIFRTAPGRHRACAEGSAPGCRSGTLRVCLAALRTTRARSTFHANFYKRRGLTGPSHPACPLPLALPRPDGGGALELLPPSHDGRGLRSGRWVGDGRPVVALVALAGFMKDIPADWAWLCTQLPLICLLMCSQVHGGSLSRAGRCRSGGLVCQVAPPDLDASRCLSFSWLDRHSVDFEFTPMVLRVL
jgi:hypothetical protein